MSTAPTPPPIEKFLDNAEQLAEVVQDLGELDEPEQFQDDLKAARAELAVLRERVEDLELMLRSMLCGGWMAVEVAGGPGDGRIALVPHDMRDEDADPYGDAAQDAFKKAEQLSLDDRGIPILTPESRAALKGRPR